MQEPTPVASYNSRPEAEIARGFLKTAGIEARVTADDGGGTLPQLALGLGVKLMVASTDLAKARLALEAPGSEV